MSIRRAAGLLAAAALLPVSVSAEVPSSEDDKVLYFLGISAGQQLKMLELSPKEIDVVIEGVRDRALGEPIGLDMRVYQPKLQAFVEGRRVQILEKEKSASAAFLEDAKKQDGAQVQESGLIYFEVEEGKGAQPERTSRVKVNYKGTLRDGTVFDESPPGSPAEFPLNGVIPCWTEALAMMKVGGKAKIMCPAEIAYRDRGTGPIPPGAALTFEVELLDVVE